MSKLCVVIPIHQAKPTNDEIISLSRCAVVLKDYEIFLLHPIGLDISIYIQAFPKLKLKPVNPIWLSSIEHYNKMKRNLQFYELFEKFNFMLTYELDSYIFSDNWSLANVFEYDYIGAPWFEPSTNTIPTGVGNSGFSIRNLQKCIEILKLKDKLKPYWNVCRKLWLHRIIKLSWMLSFFNKHWNPKGKNVYFYSFFSDNHINEDVYWCEVIPKLFNFIKAEPIDAMKFSFELNPRLLFKLNKNCLPIGCHAWRKYDVNFWQDHIKF